METHAHSPIPSFHARFAKGDFQQLLNALPLALRRLFESFNTLPMALRSLFREYLTSCQGPCEGQRLSVFIGRQSGFAAHSL